MTSTDGLEKYKKLIHNSAIKGLWPQEHKQEGKKANTVQDKKIIITLKLKNEKRKS